MPKYPYLNGIEDPHVREMLVLISSCDSLTSGLKYGLGSKWCYEVSLSLRNKVNIKEKRDSCLEIISKKNLPKSMTVESCEHTINSLVKSIMHEPACNRGCMMKYQNIWKNIINRIN